MSDSTGPVQPQIANRRLGEGQPLLGSVAIPGRQPANGGQPVSPNQTASIDRPPWASARLRTAWPPSLGRLPCRSRHRPATPTVAYDWYVNSDGTQCEVREAYVDADAFVEHAFHVREARDTLFGEFAYDRQMTIYGEPSAELVALVKSLHMEHQIKWFSFVRGLGSPVN